IIHEPDGNVTPDFLVDGRIAVEVRRLNQNEITESGKPKGLEVLQFALNNSIREVLASFGPAKNGTCWLVGYRFSRPLPNLTEIKQKVLEVLTAFRDGLTEDREFLIADRLTLNLAPATNAWPDYFVLGGFSDRNAGGWLEHELKKNIEICVREKTKKIARARAKYPEWWLVLIDRIGYGDKGTISIEHDWNKIILVNPLNPEHGYEL
ncbi:MAG: hypothetical protein WA400_18810, partial [Silvibacterium sp.]